MQGSGGGDGGGWLARHRSCRGRLAWLQAGLCGRWILGRGGRSWLLHGAWGPNPGAQARGAEQPGIAASSRASMPCTWAIWAIWAIWANGASASRPSKGFEAWFNIYFAKIRKEYFGRNNLNCKTNLNFFINNLFNFKPNFTINKACCF